MRFSDTFNTIASYIVQPAKRKLIRYCMEFRNKYGLEIGGPSSIFSLRGYVPVYLFAKKIDGVNFDTNTVWEGVIAEGENYTCHNIIGHQYIAEATNLYKIPDNKYHFVLSSHSLEHTANPLLALQEWRRVIKDDGLLVLVLPDKRFTFDLKRQYTSMMHLIEDYNNNRTEDDTTHFSEVMDADDSIGEAREELKNKVYQNIRYRCVHHHVFSMELIEEMLLWSGFETLHQQTGAPFHLITIARKIQK